MGRRLKDACSSRKGIDYDDCVTRFDATKAQCYHSTHVNGRELSLLWKQLQFNVAMPIS